MPEFSPLVLLMFLAYLLLVLAVLTLWFVLTFMGRRAPPRRGAPRGQGSSPRAAPAEADDEPFERPASRHRNPNTDI